MKTLLGVSLALVVGGVWADDRATAIAAITQSEHDFCALVTKEGKKTGFTTYVAIPSMYALTREEYREKTGELRPGESVQWDPVLVAASASGDLGYVWSRTKGSAPNTPDGKPGPRGEGLTFTVWRKQSGGDWRFIFDAGSGPTPAELQSILQHAAEQSRRAPDNEQSSTDSATAATEVRAVLADFFAVAKTEGHSAALLKYMSDGALMLDTNVCTKATALAKLPTSAADSRSSGAPLYVSASAAGDLVFAFGEWIPETGSDKPPRLCAWVWEKQETGWRFTTYHELPARPDRFSSTKARIATLR